MDEPQDMSLSDSNSTRSPVRQNRWRNTRNVMKIYLVLNIVDYSNFS
jgi:hypothetical protein